MTGIAAVVLESVDPAVIEAFQIALEGAPGLHLVVAPERRDTARPAEGAVIVVIDPAAVGNGLPGPTGAPSDRAAPALAPLVLLLDRERGAPAATPPAIRPAILRGFDDTLAWPSTPREALARLKALLRLRRAHEALARAESELQGLRESQLRAGLPVVDVLRVVLETGLRGAVDRAEGIASLARWIAARFEIPAELLDDLEHAARLHELGLIGRGIDARPPRPGLPLADAWRYAARTRSILGRHPALAGAADLIANLYENWDGTGLPAHLLQGQIPLRSRILRVLVDFNAMLGGQAPPPIEVLLDVLEEHSGTLYDPMVVIHLRASVEDDSERSRPDTSVLVPIGELEPGMVLTEDLCTDSGLKLLARRTVLNPGTIEIIRRRHQLEPIDRGAAIRRSPAA